VLGLFDRLAVRARAISFEIVGVSHERKEIMTIVTFFYYLRAKCDIDPFLSTDQVSWWRHQFHLLMDGVTDSRIHSVCLDFERWYECEYSHRDAGPIGDRDIPLAESVTTMSQLG
jgi:hypothetical protein